ncbi:MAG TPA: hypothetical protein VF884_03565 [Nitrososphaeraceae archaeon]
MSSLDSPILQTYSSVSRNFSGTHFSYSALDEMHKNVSITVQQLRFTMEKYKQLKIHSTELLKLKQEDLIDEDTLKDVLHQHQLLLEKGIKLLEHEGKYALMSNGELFTGYTLEEALSKARRKYGKRPYYAELINREHFPYLFQSNGNNIS